MERNAVQPLFLPKPESFLEKVHYAIDRDGGFGKPLLRRQLAERVENNINLEEYWTDKDDLAIAKILIEAIYNNVTKEKMVLVPDDPLCHVITATQPWGPDGFEWTDVQMEIEDRCHCLMPRDVDWNTATVGDLVTAVKPLVGTAMVYPKPKPKWGGCIVWIIVGILGVLFYLWCFNYI